MPKSQFADAKRLRPLIVYFAVAFVALLVADAVIRSLAAAGGGGRVLLLAWIVLFPLGGWLVWRRG